MHTRMSSQRLSKIVKHLVLKLLFTWIILALTFVLLLLTLSFLPYRICVRAIAYVFRKDLIGFQNATDEVFAVGKSVAGSPSFNLASYTVINGEIPIERFRTLFRERVLEARRPDGSLIYEKLTQNYAHFMWYGFLQKVKEFDLNYHVRGWDNSHQLELPEICNENDMTRIADKFLRLPWKKGLSPWECLLVHGFRSEENKEGAPQTLIVYRWDHTLADGYGIYLLHRKLFNAIENYQVPESSKKSIWWRTFRRIIFPFKLLHDTVEVMMESTVACTEWKKTNHAMEGYNSLSRPLPVSLIKGIKNKYGVNYLVVVLAAIAQALYRVHKDAGKEFPKSLKFDFPLPRPGHPGGLVNHMYLSRMQVKISPTHTIQDFKKMNETYDVVRTSLFRIFGAFIVYCGNFIPIIFGKAVLSLNKHDSFLIGNFPVSTEKLFLEGFPITDGWTSGAAVCTLAPTCAAGTTFGYSGRQRFYTTIDKSVFPSQAQFENMGSYIEEALLRMSKETKEGVAVCIE